MKYSPGTVSVNGDVGKEHTKQEPAEESNRIFIIKGKIYSICQGCSGLVRIDKPLLGSLHLCALPEERPR